jgi:hypothetical protein
MASTDLTRRVILVPGTFEMKDGIVPDWCGNGSYLVKQLSSLGLSVKVMKWSTKNSRDARLLAAHKLARALNASDCLTTLIGYSHGGSVALMASNLAKKDKVELLVTVGTPYQSYERDLNIHSNFALTCIAALIGLMAAFLAMPLLHWFGLPLPSPKGCSVRWQLPGRECHWNDHLNSIVFGLCFVLFALVTRLVLEATVNGKNARRARKYGRLLATNPYRKAIFYSDLDEALWWLRSLKPAGFKPLLWFLPLGLVATPFLLASEYLTLDGILHDIPAHERLGHTIAITAGLVAFFPFMALPFLMWFASSRFGFGEGFGDGFLGFREISPVPNSLTEGDLVARIELKRRKWFDFKEIHHQLIRWRYLQDTIFLLIKNRGQTPSETIAKG